MQYTTNYSLKKPQYADEADIEIINDNTDDVDTLIHQNRTMIAPAFDNTKAYVTGDPVEYLGALYVFTADKAAGAWDASKVEPTTAAEMGGGGASALADLDDVEITNPSRGQALLFDDDDDLWKNQTLPDASVTKEASGNPIELTDAASAPLVKCVTQITGYQEGTGTPSPDNVRPIVAYTEGEIVERGKNICSPDYAITNRNGVTYVKNADGTVTLTGTVTGGDYYCYIKVGSNPINLTIGETYTFTIWKNGVKGTGQLFGYVRLDKGSIAGQRILLTNGSATVTIEEGTTLINFYMNAGTGAVATGTYSFQIEKGSVSTDYEPYNGTTHTAQFSNSIYQGNADFVGESARASKVVLMLNTADMNNNYDYYPGWKNCGIKDLIGADKRLDITNATMNIGSILHINTTSTNDLIYFERADYNLTQTEWQALAIDVQIVIELPTTTTESITPTNLPIKSLSGYTHIESSTGEMEIEYITEGEQAIVDLIESSDHIYSTQEQAVGTWVDGKTLYERTFHFENPTKTTVGGVYAYTNALSGDYDYFEVVSHIAYEDSSSRYYVLPCFRITASETLYTQYYRDSSGSIQTSVFTGDSSWTFADIYLTIRYTKSTQTRSLSAPVTSQKSISEPLTDKTEEVPTEEEKTVEKPETEEETNETER